MKSHTEIFRLKAEATGAGRRRSWLPALAGRTTTLALAALALVGAAGCRQDMHNQPKYRPLRGTAFFADGSSSRPLVEGTVPRGTLQQNDAFFTGKSGNAPV